MKLLMTSQAICKVGDHGFKECPFCGETEILLWVNVDGLHYTKCSHCGASTDNCETAKEALRAWNERV